MNIPDVTPEQVGTYYDEWTERYRQAFGNTFQACRPTHIDDLHRYLLERCGMRDGDRVLDAGCGVCGPSIYFAAHCLVSIDAVTISKHQASTAVQLVKNAGLDDRIAVHHVDFNRLHEHFAPEIFDRVVFLESLSHAANPSIPLLSAYKVLKPGGTVYIKDFFMKLCDSEAEQRRVGEVIERVDRTFGLKTPRLQTTIDALTAIGYRQLEQQAVRFENDNSTWFRFNDAHGFDLFGGKAPCQWSDWLELRFEKPGSSIHPVLGSFTPE